METPSRIQEMVVLKERRSMEELVFLKKDEAVCTSLLVAEKFGKRHTHVIRAIENLKNDSAQNWAQCFKESFKESILQSSLEVIELRKIMVGEKENE